MISIDYQPTRVKFVSKFGFSPVGYLEALARVPEQKAKRHKTHVPFGTEGTVHGPAVGGGVGAHGEAAALEFLRRKCACKTEVVKIESGLRRTVAHLDASGHKAELKGEGGHVVQSIGTINGEGFSLARLGGLHAPIQSPKGLLGLQGLGGFHQGQRPNLHGNFGIGRKVDGLDKGDFASPEGSTQTPNPFGQHGAGVPLHGGTCRLQVKRYRLGVTGDQTGEQQGTENGFVWSSRKKSRPIPSNFLLCRPSFLNAVLVGNHG